MVVVIIVLKQKFGAEVPYDDLPVKTRETTSFVPHQAFVFEKKSLEALAAENGRVTASLKNAAAATQATLRRSGFGGDGGGGGGGGAVKSESQQRLILDMLVDAESRIEGGVGTSGGEGNARHTSVDIDVSTGNPRYERQPSSMTNSVNAALAAPNSASTASSGMQDSMTSSVMAQNDEEHIYESLELDHYENCAAAKLRTLVSVEERRKRRKETEGGGVGSGGGGEGEEETEEEEGEDSRPPLPPLPDDLPKRFSGVNEGGEA